MLNRNIKYKFDFGNPIRLLVSYIIETIENIGVILLTWLAVFLVNSILGNLTDCLAKEIFLKFCFIITIIIDLFFITLIFIPKRVILADDKILVNRFCPSLQITFWDVRGLNDRIPYTKIVYLKKHTGEIYFGARKPFFCVNNDSFVEIRTKYKSYLLPIKNSEEFIKEVNARIRIIKVFERYGINSVLAEKGLKPDEIKIRWKSQDEIEQIYYNDKNGNKIEIPLRDE